MDDFEAEATPTSRIEQTLDPSAEQHHLPAPVGTQRRVLRAGARPEPIIPANVPEVWQMSNFIHESHMAPKELDKPERIAVAIMTGLEIGLAPMMALQSICVINGRPCFYGDAMPGMAEASGLASYIREWEEGTPDSDDWTFFCETKRTNRPQPVVRKFSVRDAKRAKLWGKVSDKGVESPWVLYPQRMLQMRARSWALRDTYPDVYRGFPSREEMLDVPASVEEEAPTINALTAPEARPEPQRRGRGRRKNGAADEEQLDAKIAEAVALDAKIAEAHARAAAPPVAAQTVAAQAVQPVEPAEPKVPGPLVQRQYMAPNPNDPKQAEELGEEEIPFDEPAAPAAIRPTHRERFKAALDECQTYRDVLDCGKAWKDEKLKLQTSDDPRAREMADGMLQDYIARRDEKLRDEADGGAFTEVAAPRQEAPAEPTDRPPVSNGASASTPTPTQTSEVAGAGAPELSLNPGWPDDLEQLVAGQSNTDVRRFATYVWTGVDARDCNARYLEITASPKYQTMQLAAERIAIAKVHSATKGRR